MNRLGGGLRLVPRTAWVVAVLTYVTLALVIWYVQSGWPLVGKVAFTFGLPLILFVLILLIGYVYADAKRRGMRYVMWTLLAILVPDAIGIILYFILRDPLPTPCGACNVVVPGRFVFCPHCGAALKPTCPRCGRSVDREWANCAYCGTSLPPKTSAA